MNQLPFDLQEKVNRMQQLQNMLQQVNIQGQRFKLDLADTEQALKALAVLNPEVKVYKSIGAGVQVPMDVPEVIEELETRVQFIQIRVKTLAKQETSITERLTTLQEELRQALPQRGK